jgi:type IV fimbrial biogenesis protein FimT
MYHNPRQSVGFTLLELIITLAIIGILIAAAIPSFKDLIRNTRLTTYSNELITSLNLARSEAIKRGTNVVVGANNQLAGYYWSSAGWDVFIVGDGRTNNLYYQSGKNDTLIRAYPSLPSAFVLEGNGTITNAIQFQQDGTSNIAGSFALCEISNGNGGTVASPKTPAPYTSKLIIVSAVGRIRMGVDQYTGSGTSNLAPDGIPEKDSANTFLQNCYSP